MRSSEFATVATPDDVFFLSFSGHGYGDKNGQFYILPSDVQGSCEGVDDAMLGVRSPPTNSPSGCGQLMPER